MFSIQTQNELIINFPAETGVNNAMVTLSANVYRGLVFAARQWEAFSSSTVSGTDTGRNQASVTLTPLGDGSIRIDSSR